MKKIIFIIISLFLSFLLFAENYNIENYPDYYVKNIKPNVVYKTKKDIAFIRKKIFDFDLGVSLSYNKLMLNSLNDVDAKVIPSISIKNMLSKYDYIDVNISYISFKGISKSDNSIVKNQLYSISALYKFRPYFFQLPVFIGGGPGFVFCDPDIPNREVDKSGLFLLTEISYLIKNYNFFINYSKSTLEPFDFKNYLSIGISYYF
ncbi:MAG TPA: hypothetical protein PLD27_01665 [bacterium]|nr:hypothetical protein [bacterium]HOL48264.1 hypothetical protein [bacterium]HPQ18437.1 hypothetical protein [bacterium]